MPKTATPRPLSDAEKAKKRKENAKKVEETFIKSLPPEKRRDLHPSRTSELEDGNVAAFIRARGVPADGMDRTFATNLARAIADAEEATGETARINNAFRSPETQAQFYANWSGRTFTYRGHTYSRQKVGGRAAKPPGFERSGGSAHQKG